MAASALHHRTFFRSAVNQERAVGGAKSGQLHAGIVNPAFGPATQRDRPDPTRPTPAPSPRGRRDAGARSEHHGQARGCGAGAPQPSLDAVRRPAAHRRRPGARSSLRARMRTDGRSERGRGGAPASGRRNGRRAPALRLPRRRPPRGHPSPIDASFWPAAPRARGPRAPRRPALRPAFHRRLRALLRAARPARRVRRARARPLEGCGAVRRGRHWQEEK